MTRKQTKPTTNELLAKAFGATLLHYREASGMSQKQVAEVIGISKQSIQQFESGKHVPLLLNALKLSKYFNFSIDNLC